MAPEKNMEVSVNPDGLCHVEIDVAGKTVNLISPEILTELSAVADSIRSDSRVRGVVFLSRKADHFIGGAEIEAGKFLSDPDGVLAFVQQGRDVYQTIAQLSVPTLAAIHGACLGGGLELALACRYRLATDHRKTRLGLPEVLLGILPAWGGTTRLPRLIGLSAALDLLLTGKQLDAKRAERLGLTDRVITPKEILTQADSFLSEILAQGDAKILASRRRAQDRLPTKWLDRTPIGRMIVFNQARKNVLRATKGRYPAPLKIVETVRKGVGRQIPLALDLEQEAFSALVREEVTQNLLHVFTLRMHAGKLPSGVKSPEIVPAVRKVGVLGAGVMGAGIAQWILQHEIPVRLRDIHEEAIAKGFKTVHEMFGKLVSRKRIRPEEAADRMRRLSATTGYSGFSTCDLTIEAVAEKMEVKQRVIRELQEAAGDRAIFATNTSSLSVTTMAEAAKRPDRVLGLHFFNPVAQMPLVEVVRGKQTSDEVLAAGMAFVKQIGKTPMIVSDSPGFLVNRILTAYGNEAGLLLEEGASVEAIDRAMEAFGMPIGPFAMMDVVGLDIARHTAETIRTALRLDPAQQSRIGERLFEAGRLGKKTGGGFYRYEGRTKRVDHSEIETALAAARMERGITPRSGIIDREITDRLVLIMVNTAAWCLETSVVEGPGDVDLGLMIGAGFPPFRGGLLKYCDRLGLAAIQERLDRYARSAGNRFSPVSLINERVRNAQGFYLQQPVMLKS